MSETLFTDQEKEVKSYRALLVGPEAKFKDDEELAKGKWFADADIAIKNKQLDEQRELILKQRELINTQESLEELFDQMKQRELANSTNTQAKEVKETKPMNTLTNDDELFAKLEQFETRKAGQRNLNAVDEKLKELYGDKASEFLKSKMNELELSQEDLNVLARKSPAAFYNALGLTVKTAQESFQTPPRSEVRNDSFKPNVEAHTWSWYKKTYKNKDFITNKDINVQMAKDAAAMGDAFYDGDFYNSYHSKA